MCAVLSCFSCVRFRAILWTVAHQAPLSMGFSRKEYWCGLLCSLPGDLPNPGIEPVSPTSPALAAGSLLLAPPGKLYISVSIYLSIYIPIYISESLLYLMLTQYYKTTVLQFKKEGILPRLFCQQDTECRQISGVSLESLQ